MSARKDFEALALPHLAAAYSLARWLLKDNSDAEDIVQEAYLRAFRAFGTFSGSSIRPWLLSIVRNSAYRRLALRRRTANVVSIDEAFRFDNDSEPGEAQIADGKPNAEEKLLASADGCLAVEALSTLQAIYREVLVLREIEDLSYREIADITGIPLGTVMSRLARARIDLRTAFVKLSQRKAQ